MREGAFSTEALARVEDKMVATMTRAIRTLQTAHDDPLDLEAIAAALSKRFRVTTLPVKAVRRARLDTFDHKLRAAGLTLQHQTGGDGDVLLLAGGDTALSEPVENFSGRRSQRSCQQVACVSSRLRSRGSAR